LVGAIFHPDGIKRNNSLFFVQCRKPPTEVREWCHVHCVRHHSPLVVFPDGWKIVNYYLDFRLSASLNIASTAT